MDFLYEIGVEDLPSRFLTTALRELKTLAEKKLTELKLDHGEITTLGTPRRLTLHIAELASSQPKIEEVKTGPPVSVAFDGQGNPTKAAVSFAAKFGATEAELEVVETDKGARVQLIIATGGARTAKLLPDFARSLITDLPLPRAMRWGTVSQTFLRPIRWLVALYGEETIEFEIAGVKSGNRSRGHRYLADGEFNIATASLDDYKRRCAGMYVILDGTLTDEEGVVIQPGERYLILKEDVERLLAKYGEQGYDRALLLDVCNMVEHPTCLEGKFEERFLDLPESVVVSTLREYQKYFEVRDDAGKLLPRFIAVRDGGSRGAETVIAGHERVVRARLTDASYFWEEAKKEEKSLDELTEELDGLSFIKGLGSYGDKRRRLLAMVGSDSPNVGGVDKEKLRRAIELAKQDLLTPLVVEFTSLQGVIGGELARRHGEPEAVAEAIAEQYKPAGFTGYQGELPQTAVGAMLSLLDKLDTLAGCFANGMEPSGSADPYGLRRAARGIIGIAMGIKDHQPEGLDLASLDLWELIVFAVGNFEGETKKEFIPAEVQQKVSDFLKDRAERLFIELGKSLKATRAALNIYSPQPYVAWRAALALTKAEGSEDFANVAAGFKRARNILLKAKGIVFGTLSPDKLTEEAEKGLYNWLEENETAVDGFIRTGGFADALSLIAQSRAVIDRFFDEVMVMDKDEALRNNRLALLERMVRLFRRVGDISQMA